MFRCDCGGPCPSGNDSALSSPVAGRHFRPRDRDVTGHASGCHDDPSCVAKSLLLHDDTTTNDASTTVARAGSPQTRFLYDDSRTAAVLANSCNNVHAVVFSLKPEQQNAIPIACDCARTEDDNEEATWRSAQSPSRSGDKDVRHYVIDRQKLTSALRRTSSSTSRRTSPPTDNVKQLWLRGTVAENSGSSLTAHSSVGECRPLLVVSSTPGECCRNQRYSPGSAGVDNSSDTAK